jgi:hypothetical protein
MWWATLIPILLDIVKAWLNRKAGGQQAAGADHAEMDALAQRLEQALPKGAQAQAQGGGLFSQVQELVNALKSHDWNAVKSLLIQFLGQL